MVMLAALLPVLWWLWRIDAIRPGSLARHGTRELSASPWSVWWVGAFLMLCAQTAGGAMGLVLVPPQDLVGPPFEGPTGVSAADAAATLGGAVAALVTGVWIMWFFRTSAWGSGAGLDLRAKARDFTLGILALLASLPIMAAAMLCSMLAAQVLMDSPPDPVAHNTLKSIIEEPGSPRTWGLIFAAVILVPIVEEVLFRGLVQSAVLRLTRRVGLSVVLASVIFGAVHIGSAAPHAIVPLACFGVCMGVAYERTGRLWVPITMHMLFNALNIVQALAM
jgi:membrane protease YdiL (CAAX protease family)